VLDPRLRPLKDRLLRPVASTIGGRVAPAGVTLLGLAAGIGAAVFSWRRAYAAALVCWLLNRVLDGLDGVLARVQRRTTDRGGYLDLLADFLVYALVPIGLAAGRAEPGITAAALWLLASFYVNAMTWLYLAAVLERRGRGAAARGEQTAIAMPESVVGGTETILFYAAFLVFPEHLRVLFLAMAALTALGAAHRSLRAWRSL
jgi:phosphatidylglycerophosphate synthase